MSNERAQDFSDLEFSKLFCKIENSDYDLFFSLIDHFNNYFVSEKPSKIAFFYNLMENQEQLLQWMKERPKGLYSIHEIDGDKDIIVVIPTADFYGNYAKECREKIFKGFHIIFIESGGRGDFYFNYAHNCNVGIRRAMGYDPLWIVVSGDDMKKIDDAKVLRNNLMKEDPYRSIAVFTRNSPDNHHSKSVYVGRTNLIGKAVHFLHKIQKKGFFGIPYTEENFTAKFCIHILMFPLDNLIKLYIKNAKKILLTESFTILSGIYVKSKNGNMFNESFCNGVEDWDLSYRIYKDCKKYTYIDYLIGEYTGASLGTGKNRALRDIANFSLFNKIYQNDF